MDISVIVNIILCVLSFILAVISVVTVVITLRQNSKMIDNSTRPYIAVYQGVTNFQSPHFYICVKNFGQSGAVITSFNCDSNLKDYAYDATYIPFLHFAGSFLAPSQSFIAQLDPVKVFKSDVSAFVFSVEYKCGDKLYSDSFTINLAADSDLVHIRACTDGKELRTISYALQDIAEKLLKRLFLF